MRLALEQLEDRLTPATHPVTSALIASLGDAAQAVTLDAATTRETIGAFDPASGQWYLRASNSPGTPDIAPFAYGGAGWTPVAGDWDGDGLASPGVVSPEGVWYLKNTRAGGAPEIAPFAFGAPGWLPVVGDWNGDGITSIGVVDPATATWYLKNSNGPGAHERHGPGSDGESIE